MDKVYQNLEKELNEKCESVTVKGLVGALDFVKTKIEAAHKAKDSSKEAFEIANTACIELTGYGIASQITPYDVVCIMKRILEKEGLIKNVD